MSPRALQTRLLRMVQGASGSRLSPVMRTFWRGIAAFLLFMQVAAAAAPCGDHVACGPQAQHASTNLLDRHLGAGTEPCLNEAVSASQVQAIDAAVLMPELAPAFTVVALWPPRLSVRVPQARQYAAPFAQVPRFLAFRRLLR